jgi:2-methylcitrate dehydratase PrpD
LSDPRVLDLVKRISARIDPEIDAMGAAFRHAARIKVVTRDGREFAAELLNRRGSAENPLKPEDIDYKFRQVVRQCLSAPDIEKVVSLVRGMEKVADLGEVIGIMGAPTYRA